MNRRHMQKDNPVAKHFKEEEHKDTPLTYRIDVVGKRKAQKQMIAIGRSMDDIVKHPIPQ